MSESKRKRRRLEEPEHLSDLMNCVFNTVKTNQDAMQEWMRILKERDNVSFKDWVDRALVDLKEQPQKSIQIGQQILDRHRYDDTLRSLPKHCYSKPSWSCLKKIQKIDPSLLMHKLEDYWPYFVEDGLAQIPPEQQRKVVLSFLARWMALGYLTGKQSLYNEIYDPIKTCLHSTDEKATCHDWIDMKELPLKDMFEQHPEYIAIGMTNSSYLCQDRQTLVNEIKSFPDTWWECRQGKMGTRKKPGYKKISLQQGQYFVPESHLTKVTDPTQKIFYIGSPLKQIPFSVSGRALDSNEEALVSTDHCQEGSNKKIHPFL